MRPGPGSSLPAPRHCRFTVPLQPNRRFVAYSWWVPQIYHSARNNFRPPFKPRYMRAMTAARLLLPLYVYGCKWNVLQSPVHPVFCCMLVVWCGAQVWLLEQQQRLGAQFFVPAWLLPERYSYFRAIPAEVLDRYRQEQEEDAAEKGAGAPPATVSAPPATATSTSARSSSPGSASHRTGSTAGSAAGSAGGSPPGSPDRDPAPPPAMGKPAVAAAKPLGEPLIDCPICFEPVDLKGSRYERAITVSRKGPTLHLHLCASNLALPPQPCDHLFHTSCLFRAMDHSPLCPLCRTQLPPP